MKSIKVKNLRSIIDSGDIELSSINILLGRNSSGKSSFLRLFPLLKETSRHELRGPILWFDENYDFGDFSNTLSRHAEGDKDMITMEFTLDVSKRPNHSSYFYSYERPLKKEETITVEIGISKHNGNAFFKRIRIKIWEHDMLFETESPTKSVQLTLDGRIVTQNECMWDYGSRGILPSLKYPSSHNPLEIIVETLKEIYQSDIIKDAGLYFLWRQPLLDDYSAWNFIKENYLKQKSVKLTKKVRESENFRKLIDSAIWLNLQRLFRYVDDELSEYFTHTYYVTPLRYNYQRYMRNRDLAVEYVESSGKNVMEYILSLNEKERTSYIGYIRNLGIEVDVTGQENKGIYVTMDDGERDNIVDVGYGYSQVLPIATILWDRAYKQDRYSSNTIVIEQPEVHLHPAMQKKLARLFVEALHLAQKRGRKLTLIVETHSSSLVNRLGRYVLNNNITTDSEVMKYYQMDDERDVKIGNDDISIYLFEKTEGVTHITRTGYDKSGRIERWPIGFMD